MIKNNLKNGTSHNKHEIQDAMSIIETLHKENLPALLEIVKKCRFDYHEIPADFAEVLVKYNILRKDQIQMVLKDVVLSAVTGRTLQDIEVCSPLENRHPELLTPIF